MLEQSQARGQRTTAGGGGWWPPSGSGLKGTVVSDIEEQLGPGRGLGPGLGQGGPERAGPGGQ